MFSHSESVIKTFSPIIGHIEIIVNFLYEVDKIFILCHVIYKFWGKKIRVRLTSENIMIN